MVIIHIAYIDASIIGGVQVAVPKLITKQSKFAKVGFVNISNQSFEGITMLPYRGEGLSINSFESPFDKPDIVVFHEVYHPEFIRIYKELVKKKIPYIVVPHGSLTKQAQRSKYIKKLIANKVLFDRFIISAKGIQYLSDHEAEESISKSNYFICGNGIDIPEEKKKAFNHDKIKFLYIGRLDIRIKGLDLLIETISKNRKFMEEHNCKFYIYGPDYNESHRKLHQLISQKGVKCLIEVHHELLGEEKKKEILSADYFFLTSRSEGMPMGVLEALSYGLPCILTKGTGLASEIAKVSAGFECEASVNSIYDAIEKAVLNYDEIERKSQNARSLCEIKYDYNMIVANTIGAYSEILNT